MNSKYLSKETMIMFGKKKKLSPDLPRVCEFCEHATALKSDRTKMVCDRFGVVGATHKCRKFLYDPLKRKAFRPKIDTEDQLEHIDI